MECDFGSYKVYIVPSQESGDVCDVVVIYQNLFACVYRQEFDQPSA